MSAALDMRDLVETDLPAAWSPPVPDGPPAQVRVLRAPRSPEAAAPLRLTRRGVVVVTLAVVALCAGLVWLAALSAPGSASAPYSGPARITVHPGDTLWSIASRVAPQRDPRAEIATLQRLNHLAGAALAPGQVLRVR